MKGYNKEMKSELQKTLEDLGYKTRNSYNVSALGCLAVKYNTNNKFLLYKLGLDIAKNMEECDDSVCAVIIDHSFIFWPEIKYVE